MPSRFRLRKVFRRPVCAVAKPFISANVSPDAITYLTLLFALCAFLIITIFKSQIIYGMFVFLVGFFDGVDGAVARETGRARPAGAFTDSVIDKVSEMVILLSIWIAYPSSDVFGVSVQLWIVICIIGWIMTSYTRARAETLGVQDLDVGLGARSERLFILVLMSLFQQTLLGIVVVTLIGILTAAYRAHHYMAELNEITDHHI